jgi:phage baseplate assembly protein W
MGHSQFKFKSSGIRTDNRQFTPKVSIRRPFGIKTPLEVGDDIFKMHENPIRQIADNFRNLIMTNHGERLGLYDYGANLNSLAFEYSNSQNFESIIGESIITVASKYMPNVNVVNVSSKKIDVSEKNELNRIGLTKVTVLIEYVIPRLNSPKLGIEVDILVGG